MPKPEIKVCTTCGKQKPLDEFYTDSRNTDGHHGNCKACTRRRQRNLRRHPELKRKEGKPTKATPARIKAILRDIADGLTQAQAAALHGISEATWIDWKNNTEKFPELRAQANARRIKVLLKRKRELADKKLDWKEPAWDLERNHNFKGQFADPAREGLALGVQNNTFMITYEKAKEIEAMRSQLLPEVQARLGLGRTNGSNTTTEDGQHG